MENRDCVVISKQARLRLYGRVLVDKIHEHLACRCPGEPINVALVVARLCGL